MQGGKWEDRPLKPRKLVNQRGEYEIIPNGHPGFLTKVRFVY